MTLLLIPNNPAPSPLPTCSSPWFVGFIMFLMDIAISKYGTNASLLGFMVLLQYNSQECGLWIIPRVTFHGEVLSYLSLSGFGEVVRESTARHDSPILKPLAGPPIKEVMLLLHITSIHPNTKQHPSWRFPKTVPRVGTFFCIVFRHKIEPKEVALKYK